MHKSLVVPEIIYLLKVSESYISNMNVNVPSRNPTYLTRKKRFSHQDEKGLRFNNNKDLPDVDEVPLKLKSLECEVSQWRVLGPWLFLKETLNRLFISLVPFNKRRSHMFRQIWDSGLNKNDLTWFVKANSACVRLPSTLIICMFSSIPVINGHSQRSWMCKKPQNGLL